MTLVSLRLVFAESLSGRLSLRELFEQPEHFELVHLNDLGSAESTAYLIKRDSVHGTWQHDTRVEDEFIILGSAGRELRVPYSRAKEPALLESAYKAAGVTLVLVSPGSSVVRCIRRAPELLSPLLQRSRSWFPALLCT